MDARSSPAVALAAASALAACGGGGGGANAERFAGPKREVAAVVDRLQAAARRADGEEICQDLFTPSLARLVGRLQGCEKEVVEELAGKDATFRIVGLTVRGARATAKVEEANRTTSRLTFTRANTGAWRIAAIRTP